MQKPLLVIKFGTASITRMDGRIDEQCIHHLAAQIASLHSGYKIIIVSSGAVGTGKAYLKSYQGKIAERKAAAAIGNPLLIQMYANAFAPYGIHIAQSLCERRHFSDREQFLELRETYDTLWKNNIIPIANENDVVSSRALKFSDNDELATRIAIGFGASLLMIGTSVEGVLDAEGNTVKEIHEFDSKVLSLAKKEKSSSGLGGMISKLAFARLATGMGIPVVIFKAKGENFLSLALEKQTGTYCHPNRSGKSSRQKWITAGGIISGKIIVDAGAAEALKNRKSLLSVGIRHVIKPFAVGDIIEIADETDHVIAIGQAKQSSDTIYGIQNNNVIAHVDDVVLL